MNDIIIQTILSAKDQMDGNSEIVLTCNLVPWEAQGRPVNRGGFSVGGRVDYTVYIDVIWCHHYMFWPIMLVAVDKQINVRLEYINIIYNEYICT